MKIDGSLSYGLSVFRFSAVIFESPKVTVFL